MEGASAAKEKVVEGGLMGISEKYHDAVQSTYLDVQFCAFSASVERGSAAPTDFASFCSVSLWSVELRLVDD